MVSKVKLFGLWLLGIMFLAISFLLAFYTSIMGDFGFFYLTLSCILVFFAILCLVKFNYEFEIYEQEKYGGVDKNAN